MSDLSKLPTYRNDIPTQFVIELRSALRMTQVDVAHHFSFDRTRVSKFENHKEYPPPGYLAGLVRLIAERRGHDPDTQSKLLAESNKALRHYGWGRFHDWIDLCNTADAYSAEQTSKRQRKNSGDPLPVIPQLDLSSSSEEDWRAKVGSSLEPQIYFQLFGITNYSKRLKQMIVNSDEYWIISVEGVGGIGKTTLVDFTIRQPELGQRFQGVVWLTAKQHDFMPGSGLIPQDNPALDNDRIVDGIVRQLGLTEHFSLSPQQKQHALVKFLETSAWLFVIDNLETVADINSIMPLLRSLARPSKIVATSRYRLPNYSDVTHIHLGPISQEDVILFLRHLAEVYSFSHLTNATDTQLAQIYEYVGGNPLAIRLVVGQILNLSLPDVLQNLSKLPESEVDEFYAYLYRDSWHLLDTSERELLMLMPLVDSGVIDQLMAISDLDRSSLIKSLRRLVQMSLVEARGDLEERRYSLHRVIETFLMKELLQQKITATAPNSLSPKKQFDAGVQRNSQYWWEWFQQNAANIDKLEQERDGIVQGIRFALGVPTTLPLAHELIERFSLFMEQRGQWEIWSKVLNNAIETVQSTVDKSSLPRLSLLRARLLRRQSLYQEAVTEYLRAIQLTHQTGDQYTRARAYSNLGHLYIELDQWQQAEELCLQALEIFESEKSDHGRAHTHNHLGILYTRQCKWDIAKQHLEAALGLWQQMDDNHGLQLANLNLGKLANDMRMEGSVPPHPAMYYLELAVHFGMQTADEVMVALARMNMGVSHKLDGQMDLAEQHFLAANSVFERYGDTINLALIADNLGVICIAKQQKEEATTYLEKALHSWRELNSVYSEIRTLLYLVDCEYTLGSREAALAWHQQVDQYFGQDSHAQKYPSLYKKYKELGCSLSA